MHDRVRALWGVQLKDPFYVWYVQPSCGDVCAKQTAYTKLG